MRFFFILFFIHYIISSCSEMQQIANQIPVEILNKEGIGKVSNAEIGNGLKQALDIGVVDGVLNLGKKDGFLKNELVKILLPEELQGVDKALRNIGLASLADKGLNLLNRAAEDAVTEATPIFRNAISDMNINDASKILFGSNNSATEYLRSSTSSQLVSAFEPKIQNSLGKVGADKVWEQIITKYNLISGEKINTNLTAYVTEQSVKGVFKMIANKEADIRSNFGARSTDLLKKVFALQDKQRL